MEIILKNSNLVFQAHKTTIYEKTFTITPSVKNNLIMSNTGLSMESGTLYSIILIDSENVLDSTQVFSVGCTVHDNQGTIYTNTLTTFTVPEGVTADETFNVYVAPQKAIGSGTVTVRVTV